MHHSILGAIANGSAARTWIRRHAAPATVGGTAGHAGPAIVAIEGSQHEPDPTPPRRPGVHRGTPGDGRPPGRTPRWWTSTTSTPASEPVSPGERTRTSAPRRPGGRSSERLDRESAGLHLDLELPTEAEARLLSSGGPAAAGRPASEPRRCPAAHPAAAAPPSSSAAPAFGLEHLRDLRRAAGPGGRGLAVRALADLKGFPALVGHVVDEPLVKGAGGFRQVGRMVGTSAHELVLLCRPRRGGADPSVASVCRSRLGCTRSRCEPDSRCVGRLFFDSCAPLPPVLLHPYLLGPRKSTPGLEQIAAWGRQPAGPGSRARPTSAGKTPRIQTPTGPSAV